MGKESVLDKTWLLDIHVPDIGSPDLVAQSHDLLVLVHRESDKPDLAVLIVEDIIDLTSKEYLTP